MTKRPAKPVPKIGVLLDDDEKALYEAIESPDYVPSSILTPKMRGHGDSKFL